MLMPSRWMENFGLTGIEAMSFGKPVVAFRVGGIPDWLEDGVTGYHVPAFNEKMLLYYIRKLIEDRPLAEKMGAAALNKFNKEFSFEIIIKRYDTLLKELMS